MSELFDLAVALARNDANLIQASFKNGYVAALKKIDEIVADDEIIRNKNDLRQWITDELNAFERETK